MRRILTAVVLSSVLAIPQGDLHAAAPGAVGDLYVSSDALNVLGQYDGLSGVLVGSFATSTIGFGQMAVHFGSSNNRLLIGHGTGGVDEFDASTGAYIKTYNSAPDWQWAGLYRPNGDVLIGSWNNDDVRVYDALTGAFISVLTPALDPADMAIGPNGNLYICGYADSSVTEVDVNTGAFISQWNLPFGSRTNDIAFIGSDFLVTAMGTNMIFRYDASHNMIGVATGTGWMRPHGITIGPWDGNIYAADGVTQQVHVFDPATMLELNPAFLSPLPGGKIVDLEFKPAGDPVSTEPSTWGRVKGLYR